MSLPLRLGIGAIILIGALAISREYSAFYRRRIAQTDGFVALIIHIEGAISERLASGKGLVAGFSDEALSSLGFLESVRSGATLHDAFLGCRRASVISREVSMRLERYFADFGRYYKERELSRAATCVEELERLLERERADMPKNVKLARTLLVAFALGVLILIV